MLANVSIDGAPDQEDGSDERREDERRVDDGAQSLVEHRPDGSPGDDARERPREFAHRRSGEEGTEPNARDTGGDRDHVRGSRDEATRGDGPEVSSDADRAFAHSSEAAVTRRPASDEVRRDASEGHERQCRRQSRQSPGVAHEDGQQHRRPRQQRADEDEEEQDDDESDGIVDEPRESGEYPPGGSQQGSPGDDEEKGESGDEAGPAVHTLAPPSRGKSFTARSRGGGFGFSTGPCVDVRSGRATLKPPAAVPVGVSDAASREAKKELALDLIAHLEDEELTLAETIDRIEAVTTSPSLTREVLDEAEMRGLIDREDARIRTRTGGTYVRFESQVVQREGGFDCRRCGASITTGHFVQFDAGELGPFGSSCIRKILGRE